MLDSIAFVQFVRGLGDESIIILSLRFDEMGGQGGFGGAHGLDMKVVDCHDARQAAQVTPHPLRVDAFRYRMESQVD